jgi:hypothetical protein
LEGSTHTPKLVLLFAEYLKGAKGQSTTLTDLELHNRETPSSGPNFIQEFNKPAIFSLLRYYFFLNTQVIHIHC